MADYRHACPSLLRGSTRSGTMSCPPAGDIGLVSCDCEQSNHEQQCGDYEDGDQRYADKLLLTHKVRKECEVRWLAFKYRGASWTGRQDCTCACRIPAKLRAANCVSATSSPPSRRRRRRRRHRHSQACIPPHPRTRRPSLHFRCRALLSQLTRAPCHLAVIARSCTDAWR